jgi:hypothetical protein
VWWAKREEESEREGGREREKERDRETEREEGGEDQLHALSVHMHSFLKLSMGE